MSHFCVGVAGCGSFGSLEVDWKTFESLFEFLQMVSLEPDCIAHLRLGNILNLISCSELFCKTRLCFILV